MTNFKVNNVEILPLGSKHYATEILLDVGDFNSCGVEVHGYSPRPSTRELANGWEEIYGMDHVEPEIVYEVALVIEKALKEHFGLDNKES